MDHLQSLPFCPYPEAGHVTDHGLQALPSMLPTVNFTNASPYRSTRYKTVNATNLSTDQLRQMARAIAESFAKRDPMSRHLNPPVNPPVDLTETRHSDFLGIGSFDQWTREDILFWFIRLFVLTDPTSPSSDIQTNQDILTHSLAMVDENGQVIGGAFNETLAPPDAQPMFRDDVHLDAALSYLGPILELLGSQVATAIPALYTQYPEFQKAHEQGKVGHHFMIARSDCLPRDHAFELVARTVEQYREHGYHYVVTEASNQWTGAAFEALGGVRVHFMPYRAEKTIFQHPTPLEDQVTSVDGFIADKDSGSMMYIVRLI